MAIFKMPFMHILKQSMAENTYIRSKGKNIVKTKIDTNSSKTEKQQIQRLKMKVIVGQGKVFNAAIHVGFPERPRGFTPWNAFTSANIPAIMIDEGMEASVDYESFRVSQGSLEVVEDVQVVKDAEAHALKVTHSVDSYGYGMNEDDVLHMVVLEREKRRSRVFKLNERKDATPATVTLPNAWEMDNLLVYVFVLSANGRKASDSVFVKME